MAFPRPHWSAQTTRGYDSHFGAPAIHTELPAYPLTRQRLALPRTGRPALYGRHRPWWERPPRPRAWCGHGALRVFTRWPSPSKGRSRPNIPSGKATERRYERGGSTDRSGLRVSLASQVAGPVVHEPAPALEQIRAPVGCLDLVAGSVCQRRLHDLAGMIRLFDRPVAE